MRQVDPNRFKRNKYEPTMVDIICTRVRAQTLTVVNARLCVYSTLCTVDDETCCRRSRVPPPSYGFSRSVHSKLLEIQLLPTPNTRCYYLYMTYMDPITVLNLFFFRYIHSTRHVHNIQYTGLENNTPTGYRDTTYIHVYYIENKKRAHFSRSSHATPSNPAGGVRFVVL